jgi:hypothetical protein
MNMNNEKLLAYYFGVLDGQDRHDVEEQLLSSPAILMDFIALKRSFEVDADPSDGRVPSPTAAARLRREVEVRFGKKESNVFVIRVGRWVPAAVAAMLLVLAGGYSLYTKTQHKAVDAKPIENRVSGAVDTSGDAAVSLSVL